jgi:N-succinyldiaminopimelate aminotransferase
MPKPPSLAPVTRLLKASVFSQLAAQAARLPEPPIPLHLGDTFRAPPSEAQYRQVAAHMPERDCYTNPNGHDGLRQALVDRCAAEGLPGLTREHVQVTAGGTGAIHTVFSTWLSPGDEVLILAPFWPIVRGIVNACGGVPVEVPFYAGLRAGRTVAELVAPYLSERTVALYVTSPNNPCGTVLTPAQVAEVASFCVKHDLWTLADEAYHHYVYDGAHTWLAAQPGMAERTATIFTASKSYALAGSRVGFLVGDPAWLDASRRVMTQTLYHVPTIAQLAAKAAIEHGSAWVEETRAIYREAAELTSRTLQAPHAPAQGGGYVFADLAGHLRERPLHDWLAALLQSGVSVAPGDVFGQAFGQHVRVCFTAVPRDRLEVALGRLNRALEALRAG